MFLQVFKISVLSVVLVSLLGAPGSAMAATGEDLFFRAYYLEAEQQDWKAAAELYEKALADSSLHPKMRAFAQNHLAACREELATADFASLVPSSSLVYAEFSRPGEHLQTLLDQLGLLATPGKPAVLQAGEMRVAVSPALIEELLGMRGAALAVTGFDFARMEPSGVVILHPGNLEVIRGLLETGLPIGGAAVEPILDFPTYNVENEAFITLTHRLILASRSREQIEAVALRLAGREDDSLATNPDVAEELGHRGDDLLFFMVNARPVMGMANMMMAAGGTGSPEIALARTVLDPNSLRSVVGRAGINESGVFLDLSLRLTEGHRNLVYNFLRTPPISRQTLACVPQGAAAFFATAMNPPPGEGLMPARGEEDVVTALDFGRELFANITSLAVFVMSPDPANPSGMPMPDVGAVITVNDPSRSEALWTQMLGLASLGTGGGTMEGISTQIDGTKARTFRMPNGIEVLFATAGNDVLLATSSATMARAIAAKKGDHSVLNDPAFAAALEGIGPHTTKAILAHPGRAMEIGGPFMGPQERAWADQVRSMMSDTVASFVVDHSSDRLHLGLKVSNLPDVSPLVNDQLARQRRSSGQQSRFATAIGQQNWKAALAVVEEQIAEDPGNTAALENRCRIHAYRMPDAKKADAACIALYERVKDDPAALNNTAWAFLTQERCEGKLDQVALTMARRANELTGHRSWAYLDTLALAQYRTGDVHAAVKTQRKAIELAGDRDTAELQERLAQFEAAGNETHDDAMDG